MKCALDSKPFLHESAEILHLVQFYNVLSGLCISQAKEQTTLNCLACLSCLDCKQHTTEALYGCSLSTSERMCAKQPLLIFGMWA